MAKRRGRNEGSISLRADGRWQGRIDIGRGTKGRRRRKTIYGPTREAVATKLNKGLGAAAGGALLTTSSPPLATLLDLWYATHEHEWRPTTRRIYRTAITDWIGPPLGAYRLEALQPIVIQQWFTDAAKHGPRQYLITARCVLRSALKWAMTQHAITYNAADSVKVRKPAKKKITPLTVEQGRALLAACGSNPLGATALIALAMGLRIGEVLGVRWPDVDLKTRDMRLRQQLQDVGKKNGGLVLVELKTVASRRTLTMPALVVTALKRRRTAQLADRLRAGATWNNEHDLVFTTPDGQPLHPNHVRRQVFTPLLAKAGIERTRFHNLRHSLATLLLDEGEPLFNVSRVLGHSEISTTADIYADFTKQMAERAATRMDGILTPKAKP